MFMICLRVQFQQMQDLFYTILGTLYVGIGLGSLVLLRGGSHLIPSGKTGPGNLPDSLCADWYVGQ